MSKTYCILADCGMSTQNNGGEFLWPDIIACLNYFYKSQPIQINKYTFINQFDKIYNLNINNYIKKLDKSERDYALNEIIENGQASLFLNPVAQNINQLSSGVTGLYSAINNSTCSCCKIFSKDIIISAICWPILS